MTTQRQATLLDEIRQVEILVASQVLLARQEAEGIKQAASDQAKHIIDHSRQAGAQAGQARQEKLMQETALQAEQIITEARARAEAGRISAEQAIAEAVQWSLDIVLGFGQGGHNQ
jgi:vacuolar-type H+-ATPase subunit H